jgi:hypothetical protein
VFPARIRRDGSDAGGEYCVFFITDGLLASSDAFLRINALTTRLPLPYTSERRFLVIQYLIGHGLLLLRSNKPDKGSKRIDILFNDVRAMEIRCWFDGITIEEQRRVF